MSIENTLKMTNVDNNFVNHITNFQCGNALEEHILKSIILYMCYSFQQIQYNLFEQREIDPAVFSKVMNIDRADLQRKHDNPLYNQMSSKSTKELEALQTQHGAESKYRLWDSYFENALFTLSNKSLMQSYSVNQGDGKRIVLRGFKYIDEIQFAVRKKGRTKSYTYYYTPSKDFENNLIKFYSLVNISTFVGLRKKGLSDLYIFLITKIEQYDNYNQESILVPFKELADYCGVSTERLDKNSKNAFSDIKYKIKDKIVKKMIPEMQSNVDNLKFQWIKGTKTKVANIGSFTWRKKTKNEIKIYDQNKYRILFLNELIKKLVELYKKIHAPHEQDLQILYNGFLRWLCSYQLSEEKEAIYIAVYVSTRSHVDNIPSKARKFFIMFSDLKNLYDHKRFIFYKEDKFWLSDPENDRIAIENQSLIPSIEHLGKFSKHYNNQNSLLQVKLNKTIETKSKK